MLVAVLVLPLAKLTWLRVRPYSTTMQAYQRISERLPDTLLLSAQTAEDGDGAAGGKVSTHLSDFFEAQIRVYAHVIPLKQSGAISTPVQHHDSEVHVCHFEPRLVAWAARNIQRLRPTAETRVPHCSCDMRELGRGHPDLRQVFHGWFTEFGTLGPASCQPSTSCELARLCA